MDHDSKKADGALPAPAEIPVNATTRSLAPGFRFHPTDEELVSYYLKRKILSKTVCFDAIAEVDIYKHEPCDLAEHSRLKTNDQEWYFFIDTTDKKFGTGDRMCRTTTKGFWRANDGDSNILRRGTNEIIGKKRTLVFHSGFAPTNQKTGWLMHEYRFVQDEPGKNEPLQSVQQKNRVPHFSEQDWDDNSGRALIPGENVSVMAPDHNSIGVDANSRNNEILQEQQSQSKNLFDLNELPSENNDEPLERESAAQERCLPLFVLNNEAQLPIVPYKRKSRDNSTGNSNNSSKTTQDHCSSTSTTPDTTSNAAISAALLDFPLIGWSDKKKNEPEPVVAAMVPASSYTKLINDLQKEKETLKLKLMRAETSISVLEKRINELGEENNELRENSSKRQCS